MTTRAYLLQYLLRGRWDETPLMLGLGLRLKQEKYFEKIVKRGKAQE